MKQLKVNKKYGTWYYEKQVDFEDSKNYIYSLYGKDINGKEWSYSVLPSYKTLFEIVKASEEDKERMLSY